MFLNLQASIEPHCAETRWSVVPRLPKLFFDINAHTALMAVGWAFLGFVNSAIYFAIAAVIGRLLWKSD